MLLPLAGGRWPEGGVFWAVGVTCAADVGVVSRGGGGWAGGAGGVPPRSGLVIGLAVADFETASSGCTLSFCPCKNLECKLRD